MRLCCKHYYYFHYLIINSYFIIFSFPGHGQPLPGDQLEFPLTHYLLLVQLPGLDWLQESDPGVRPVGPQSQGQVRHCGSDI